MIDESEMPTHRRPYRLKRRAELEQATRRRITESAVELHGTLGPARTSISAIAEHAGVRRSTVYRHFPDEKALFTACTAHWTACNPPPSTERWKVIRDPGLRLHTALNELYAYYRHTGRMLDNVLRDEPSMPVISEMLTGYREYLTAAQRTLLQDRRVRGRALRCVRAAISHALAFSTWQSLTTVQGLDDGQAAALMTLLVTAAAGSKTPAD